MVRQRVWDDSSIFHIWFILVWRYIYASMNLKTTAGFPEHADDGTPSMAEAATLQLEMKYLAKLTCGGRLLEEGRKSHPDH